MKDWTRIRERYRRDSVPIRLGGLAANLARIHSFANHDANQRAVEYLLDESKWFIEWTASEADIDMAAELVGLQIQLAQWQRQWAKIWADRIQRRHMSEQVHEWAEHILERSGLLQAESAA